MFCCDFQQYLSDQIAGFNCVNYVYKYSILHNREYVKDLQGMLVDNFLNRYLTLSEHLLTFLAFLLLFLNKASCLVH